LVQQVTVSINSAKEWLTTGVFSHFSTEQLDKFTKGAIDALQSNQAKLTSGVFTTAGTITEIVTGALLMFFTLVFLLQGGRNIYAFTTKIFPTNVRERVRDAGRAGFHSLIGYVRATFLVALVDAVGIGTGLAIIGIPLALPLASLVFLGAFIPLVGAVIAGGLAVIVALIAKGWVFALITLGLIIAVQQLESHILQPLVMGRAVSVHPLAVVLAIAGGGVLAGIIGALLAVPVVAVLNSSVRVLLAEDPAAEEQALEAEVGPAIKAEPDELSDAEATAGPPDAADPQR
jgi:predicted PurR-regulated permease PerM